jgi:hypothetical protein
MEDHAEFPKSMSMLTLCLPFKNDATNPRHSWTSIYECVYSRARMLYIISTICTLSK